MPVRACTVRDLPAVRWGRHGTPYAYGHGTGRTFDEAYRLAARQGLAWATRRLERDRQLGRVHRHDAPYTHGVRGVTHRTPRRRGRRAPLLPDSITEHYEAMLTQRTRLVARLFLEHAGPAITQMEADHAQRMALLGVLNARADARARGATAEEVDRLVRLDGPENVALVLGILQVVRRVVVAHVREERDGLTYIGEEIDEVVTNEVDGRLSRLINIPLAAAAGSQERIDRWVEENIGLIVRLNELECQKIEQMVRDAMSAGTPTLKLAEAIRQTFDVPWWHASLLARDQTAKLASQINEKRQTDYGITHYEWSTSGDPRVRQSHAALDGQIFAWAEGAPGQNGTRIHPGREYQCRCDALPVLPDANVADLIAAAEARQERELAMMQRSPTVLGTIPNRSGFGNWNSERLAELRAGVRSAVGL